MKPDPKMERHISRIYTEPHMLFDAADAVNGLAAHPGWQHVTRLIEWEIATIDSSMDGANEPLTQAQYAHRHGRRDGLRALQAAVDSIVAVGQREYDRRRSIHERDAESSLNGGGQ